MPGPTLETFVGADINTILITNLLSGMDYNVKIFASQAAGFSDALTGLVKTRKTDVPGLASAPCGASVRVTQALLLRGSCFSFPPCCPFGMAFPGKRGVLFPQGSSQACFGRDVTTWLSNWLHDCG